MGVTWTVKSIGIGPRVRARRGRILANSSPGGYRDGEGATQLSSSQGGGDCCAIAAASAYGSGSLG